MSPATHQLLFDAHSISTLLPPADPPIALDTHSTLGLLPPLTRPFLRRASDLRVVFGAHLHSVGLHPHPALRVDVLYSKPEEKGQVGAVVVVCGCLHTK